MSAAGWYDQAYSDDSDHPGLNCEYRINGNCTDTWGLLSAPPGELSNDAEDQAYRGGELLDAFVFGNFTVGEQSEASVRLGRHTIRRLGEALLPARELLGARIRIDPAS